MQINVFCALYLALYADENFFSDFAVPELHLVLYAGPYYTRVFTVAAVGNTELTYTKNDRYI